MKQNIVSRLVFVCKIAQPIWPISTQIGLDWLFYLADKSKATPVSSHFCHILFRGSAGVEYVSRKNAAELNSKTIKCCFKKTFTSLWRRGKRHFLDLDVLPHFVLFSTPWSPLRLLLLLLNQILNPLLPLFSNCLLSYIQLPQFHILPPENLI